MKKRKGYNAEQGRDATPEEMRRGFTVKTRNPKLYLACGQHINASDENCTDLARHPYTMEQWEKWEKMKTRKDKEENCEKCGVALDWSATKSTATGHVHYPRCPINAPHPSDAKPEDI